MRRLCDFEEMVRVERKYVRALLKTLVQDSVRSRDVRVRESIHALMAAAEHQEGGAEVWLVPAEPLWWAQYLADAIRVYGLDEEEAGSYDHPAVAAEHWVSHYLHQQAPRTDAALGAVCDAEVHLIMAQHGMT